MSEEQVEHSAVTDCSMRPSVDDVLKNLRGNKETFRAILSDKDKLMEKACRYAAWKAKQENLPAWSIIGDIFGHGSGVSSAIYELYRPYE